MARSLNFWVTTDIVWEREKLMLEAMLAMRREGEATVPSHSSSRMPA